MMNINLCVQPNNCCADYIVDYFFTSKSYLLPTPMHPHFLAAKVLTVVVYFTLYSLPDLETHINVLIQGDFFYAENHF
jgi:hypothetical protein